MIRIFLADDHPIVRQGLHELIDRQPDMTVVGEAEDGHAVMQAEGRAEWDILLLDLSLPRLSGIEVIRRLAREGSTVRIVVLSMYPESQYAAQLTEEGIAAYLSKSLSPVEILDAIRVVARGHVLRSPAASAGHDDQRHRSLSARENQVFMRLCQGRTVTEIAAELDVSVSTASTHVTNIKNKLGARSIGDIINYAHRVGSVE